MESGYSAVVIASRCIFYGLPPSGYVLVTVALAVITFQASFSVEEGGSAGCGHLHCGILDHFRLTVPDGLVERRIVLGD